MPRLPILGLALRSLLSRRGTVVLTVLTIMISVSLLLGVERIRTEARASFASTISGTDLIVGARSGALNLLLYSVFRMGEVTNNMSWESYQEIAERDEVAWTVPLSLGDAHRGFRVLGTTEAFFEHYKYGQSLPLSFQEGRQFNDLFEAVIGAQVADELGYQVGSEMVVAHGLGATSFAQHDDNPFVVSGVLARTGTPVDRTVHVGLQAIEAIHIGWESGARMPGVSVSEERIREMSLQPESITAALVGLESRLSTFQLQREINDYSEEALMAIIPGVVLQQLWSLLGNFELTLRIISAVVVLAGLTSMLIAILTTLNERRREMAILRSLGARPWQIFALLISESAFLAGIGALFGLALVYMATFAANPVLKDRVGISIGIHAPSAFELVTLALVLVAALLMGMIPAWRAYRNSLADGMTIRL